MLVFEIEYLLGISFAAIGPDSPEPDWPPQPDRIFSALVATWAARGQSDIEAKALKWLEKQSTPHILASAAEPRTAPAVYVPPNDYEIRTGELLKVKWYRDFLSKGVSPPKEGGHKKLWLEAWSVMPDQRKRSGLKERSFPATRPHDPLVYLIWQEAFSDEAIFSALDALARDMSYIGHSKSLTRCRFLLDPDAPDLSEARRPERRFYPGRFSELRRSFDAGRRPSPGARVAPERDKTRERNNVFASRWLILEHVNGYMPDLRACALVARSIRDTLMSGYNKAGLGEAIPEQVSGHDPDGKPTQQPHLAILPLAFLGSAHAAGHLMGFALVPPSGSDLFNDPEFRSALRDAAPIDENHGRRVLTVQSEAGTSREIAFCLKLSPTFEVPASKRSLDPYLYTRRSRIFATATPIVLDRHLKKKGAERDDEIAEQIAAGCRNIGLPEPISIVPDKHSGITGAPSAYPSGKSPSWMRWRLPPSLASRQITHAVIEFEEPVDGPVILGAGRFAGLGLCRPLGQEKR